ncbi:hypothetical protein BEK98_22285 [Streptomyces diastatochromogenes]|uniref:Uncharacterized protein n=1 Tax=Streptomyces diastatochromogenes TaxID=42236 RepID=A0A233SCQ7_STRDA|nr:hypothetical protein BEK98_22285 [Streptomyces diastatochromogenes]
MLWILAYQAQSRRIPQHQAVRVLTCAREGQQSYCSTDIGFGEVAEPGTQVLPDLAQAHTRHGRYVAEELLSIGSCRALQDANRWRFLLDLRAFLLRPKNSDSLILVSMRPMPLALARDAKEIREVEMCDKRTPPLGSKPAKFFRRNAWQKGSASYPFAKERVEQQAHQIGRPAIGHPEWAPPRTGYRPLEMESLPV